MESISSVNVPTIKGSSTSSSLAMKTNICLLTLSVSLQLASCQFMPQSHLGRLVQSFTSPLVLQSSSSADSSADGDSYGDHNSQPYYGPGSESANEQSLGPEPRPDQEYRKQALQSARLQQAPSQHRDVPQRYYGGHEDDQGAAPSNSRHNQEYQMGADLGPTIDDKEMQGVFNSNNDERDDDDASPAGDGFGPMAGATGGSGRSRAATSSAYSPSSAYGRMRGPANEDDSADDEEDAPRSARAGSISGRRKGRLGYLNQAASHFRQRPSQPHADRHGDQGPLVAAANGYAPYGYPTGPVDLSSMMAGMGGPQGFGPAQMFQGDGSYPGANYYQQQRQRGGRSQAESAQNGYYNTGFGRAEPNQQPARDQRDHDEPENEADDDRRRA